MQSANQALLDRISLDCPFMYMFQLMFDKYMYCELRLTIYMHLYMY